MAHAGSINRPGPQLVGLAMSAMSAFILALLSTARPAVSEPPANRVRYQRQAATPRVRADALDLELEQAKRAQPCEANDIFRDRTAAFVSCRHCVDADTLAKQIAFLNQLIATTPEDDVEYPDYLFRLADLYLEENALHELEAARLQARIDEQACSGDS